MPNNAATLISRYKVYVKDLSNQKNLSQKLQSMQFWAEEAYMVRNDGKRRDTISILCWTKGILNKKYGFKFLRSSRDNLYFNGTEWLQLNRSSLKSDTIKLELYHKEFVRNSFVYLNQESD